MTPDTPTCYTIGHSNHEAGAFISLLWQHGITCVADVRSAPYSSRNPQFNREAIQARLLEAATTYVYLGDSLGARQTGPGLLYPDGRTVNFKKVRETEAFRNGIQRVLRGVREGYRIALMCAEKDPFACHRFMLVSPALAGHGIQLRHILADGAIVMQQQLEEKLLEAHAPDWRQSSLFTTPLTRAEALAEAYDRRNREFGHRLPQVTAIEFPAAANRILS